MHFNVMEKQAGYYTKNGRLNIMISMKSLQGWFVVSASVFDRV